MSTKPTFVIVGAGLAGAKAAETLRADGFDGRLLLLGGHYDVALRDFGLLLAALALARLATAFQPTHDADAA